MMWPNSIAIWVVVSMALLGYGGSVHKVMSGCCFGGVMVGLYMGGLHAMFD